MRTRTIVAVIGCFGFVCAVYGQIMVILVVVLLAIWVIVAVVGFAIKGLVWIAIIGIVLFIATGLIGLLRRRTIRRRRTDT